MNPLLPPEYLDAAKIFAASRSSFALAFRFLDKNRRDDLVLFYAFCRVIDDLADDENIPLPLRNEALMAWRHAFSSASLSEIPHNLRALIQRRSLPISQFLELLDGAASDIAPAVRMISRADLDLYCHRVAGVVGQLCLPIFGSTNPAAVVYADNLGRALQYTNILRDAAADISRNRCYFPQDEMEQFGISADTFLLDHSARLRFLQSFADSTSEAFDLAKKSLPADEAKILRPARAMEAIYFALFQKILRGNLCVTESRCRLSTFEKMAAASSVLF